MILLEACVTSPAEAVEAFRTGARRVELCRELEVGGRTPPHDDVARTLESAAGPVMAMVRPRAGSFRTTPAEVATMATEIERLVALGVDGVVLGVLDARGRIDGAALSELVDAAAGRPVTFHRAFDALDDLVSGIPPLTRAGVRRVLTSGGAATAWEGRTTLRALVREASDDLVVLGGGGIRGDHVRALLETTGLTEVHARASAIPGLVEALA